MTQTDDIKMVVTHDRQERQPITRVWQKWRFSAPQTHLWLIKVWFSASTFVVKIATFAKPETVKCKPLTFFNGWHITCICFFPNTHKDIL
jgi:hypothetical protein